MRTSLLRASLVSLALAVPLAAQADTSLDVRLSVSTAPPPPPIAYREIPKTEVVPNTTVHVVVGKQHDYDYFRYGVYWYIYRSNHWYRARKYRGPFTVVEAKYVPRAIINVPQRFWRHHPHGGPPGQMKKVNGVRPGAKAKKGKRGGR